MTDLKIYGQTHSPWVQAALLGAHNKKLDYQLVTATPLQVLFRWGVTMPAAQFDGEAWIRESADILSRMGYSPLADGQMSKIQRAWQGVLHRPDSAFKFFREFSLAGDPSRSFFRRTLQNFFRSFSAFYFYLLIRSVAILVKPKEPEDFGEQYLYWEQRLSDSKGAFISGQSPDTEDFLVFGVIQCHCSIPVPATVPIINDDRLPGLRNWIESMQSCLGNYPYHYSAKYFGDKQQQPTRASGWDQFCFFFGLATWMISFPISIPAFILCRTRTPRNNGKQRA